MPEEGVIKYKLSFARSEIAMTDTMRQINAWRQILLRLKILGQDPARYDGAGFGNLSYRYASSSEAIDENAFIISGSQTGHIDELGQSHYALVKQADTEANHLSAVGLCEPSSEALTHAVIYQHSAKVACVMHVHSPEIWQMANKLELPTTSSAAAYGSLDMVADVRVLVEKVSATEGIIVMQGHQDGVLAYATSINRAGCLLIEHLAAALTLHTE